MAGFVLTNASDWSKGIQREGASGFRDHENSYKKVHVATYVTGVGDVDAGTQDRLPQRFAQHRYRESIVATRRDNPRCHLWTRSLDRSYPEREGRFSHLDLP